MTTYRLRPPVPSGPPVRLAMGRLVRLLLLTVVVVALMGLGSLSLLASAVPLRTALGAVLLALVLSAAVGVAWLFLAPRRGRVVVRTELGALVLPTAIVLRILTVMWLVLGLGISVILVAGGVLGVDLGPRLASPVVGVVLAVILVVAAVRTPRQGGFGPRVELRPDGLTRRGGGTTATVAWDAIGDVRLVAEPAVQLVLVPRVPTYRREPGPVTPPPPFLVPLAPHASDPTIVWALVRHYWLQREQRPELGTDAVVDRLVRGDLLGR